MTSYAMQPDVILPWRYLTREDDSAWGADRSLYAYLAPDKKEILYIGMTWSQTIRRRWTRSAKEDLWESLEQQRGIMKHYMMIAEPQMREGTRLSEKLLKDIESLLIIAERPWGNIQSIRSRTHRPGFILKCTGSWKGQSRIYVDTHL